MRVCKSSHTENSSDNFQSYLLNNSFAPQEKTSLPIFDRDVFSCAFSVYEMPLTLLICQFLKITYIRNCTPISRLYAKGVDKLINLWRNV